MVLRTDFGTESRHHSPQKVIPNTPTLFPSSRLDVEGLQLLEVSKALFLHEGLDVGVGLPGKPEKSDD